MKGSKYLDRRRCEKKKHLDRRRGGKKVLKVGHGWCLPARAAEKQDKMKGVIAKSSVVPQ